MADSGLRRFIVVALVGGAAEMAVAFSAARRNRLDMSFSIALGSASQIALSSRLCWCCSATSPGEADGFAILVGTVTKVMIATVVACIVTNGGRSAWFVDPLLLCIYAIFAMTLYVVPPGSHGPV